MTINAPIKHTEYLQTSTGPVAKINGKWCSVNGNHQEITDVRHVLNTKDLQRFGLENDGMDDLKMEMIHKDRELRMIDTAISSLRELYAHGLDTGVAYTVLENMMSSESSLIERAQQVREYVAQVRATHNI